VITSADVEKLCCFRSPQESVLSLYVQVPRDPAGLREVPARARGLIAAAAGQGSLRSEDEQVALGLVAAHRRAQLGHTLGVFVCGDLGLSEVTLLPGGLCERAVLAVRPHVRPLLATLQRHPDYCIAIIDRRHAWLLAVNGEQVETVAAATGDTVASRELGGWHGLDSYHLERRVDELARHHYRDAAQLLAAATRRNGPEPLVVGGHADGINHLLAELAPPVRDTYAGCFAADAHVLTPARARDLAEPVIARWSEVRERQEVERITGPASGVRAAIGPHACLAAVNAEAAKVLLIPDGGTIPGYRCERCGALSLTGDECCDWGVASRPVPDLLEEMALQAAHAGAAVVSVAELPCGAAASLR